VSKSATRDGDGSKKEVFHLCRLTTKIIIGHVIFLLFRQEAKALNSKCC